MEESEGGQQGRLGARPSQQPLPAVSPARLAYPLALASFVLALIGTILGGLEVGLMASFFDASFPENMPDPLTALVFFSLFAAIPVGSWRPCSRTSPAEGRTGSVPLSTYLPGGGWRWAF